MKEAFENVEVKPHEKLKVTKADIIVTGTKKKPYFEIKYKEVGKKHYNIGYSSYDLNNVFKWREEEMDIVSEVEAEFGKDINVRGNGWIPCSERLPEKHGRYLVCNDGVAWIADFFNSTWFGKRCRYSDVIAWMPLPSPFNPTTD